VEEPGRDPSQRTFDLLLAQEISADLGWQWLKQRDPLFSGLKQRLTQAMADTLGETDVPAHDLVQIGTALGLLGDPRPGVCALPPVMVRIAGGSFLPGITLDEQEEWLEAYNSDFPHADQERIEQYLCNLMNNQEVRIATFELARFPVTNGQYELFVNGGGYDPQGSWWDEMARAWLVSDDTVMEELEDWERRQDKSRPAFWDDEIFGRARLNQPVVGINWYEAMAFCRWLTQYLDDGYEYVLPNEAEWEYAARGSTRRRYPWGNIEPNANLASYKRIYGFTTLVVGCFPRGATPEGVLDLAGNVWEWTSSEYKINPDNTTSRLEPANRVAGRGVHLCGSSWHGGLFNLRAANRTYNEPYYYRHSVGFRLARRPRPRNH
jgi:formylglycine-generating enzyme required for sulfatase activity